MIRFYLELAPSLLKLAGDFSLPVLQRPDTFVEIEDMSIKGLDAIVEALDAGIQICRCESARKHQKLRHHG